ncbi:unnamed protein product [Prunus brigantina]
MAMVDATDLGDLAGKCNLGIFYMQGLIFPVYFFSEFIVDHNHRIEIGGFEQRVIEVSNCIACTHLEILRLPVHLCKFLNVILL